MLHQLIKPAIIIFSIMLPVWVVLRLIINAYKKQSALNQRELLLSVFYVYITCILIATVVPIPMTRHQNPQVNHINPIPIVQTYKEFKATFLRGNISMKIHTLENVLGNVVLFFPLGVILPLLSPKLRSLPGVLLAAILFSFSIELTQYISRHFGNYRSVDIDDIILNTLGAVLGFVLMGKRLARNYKWQ